ncbi:MAG: RNA polymerase sigma factor [Cyclobacteriaceae bacterium]|nr:MAG: RNA polymerase sigma factor [Cyclobacteriaceae bacterium]
MDFETLYRLYWGKIFRVCMGYVGDRDLAQDIAQDTFVIVWQQLSSFRNESNIGTWIYRIATNNCLRQLEKQKRSTHQELSHHLPEEKQQDLEPQIQLLYQFIAELPEIDRIIISLELEDVKQAEIAQIVGLSESNIRVKIHRIKERLNKRFKEHGE